VPDFVVPTPQPGGTVNIDTAERGIVRPGSRNEQSLPSRTGSTDQIRRVRTIPRQPTPTEQKESLDTTITGLEEVMNRQDDSMSAEERAEENELWQSLIDALRAEQKQLDSEEKVQSSQPESDTQREEPEEKEASEEEKQSNSR
jgi:hypothetical protein